jgi:hypothetical protein
MASLTGGLAHAAEEWYQGAATAGDAVAGDTDEAVGRAAYSIGQGDWAGAGDALAGDFDEATGRIIYSASRGDWAGVGDAAAGDVDEATGRATSSPTLAGTLDAAFGGLDEATGQYIAGNKQQWDAALGSVDESVGRQFDDEPGGGFADLALDGVDLSGQITADVLGAALPDGVDPWMVGVAALVALYVVSAGGSGNIPGVTD